MEAPLLTIITVNYNNADGLTKTFQSVFDQSFSNYEYVVIDGGSTDASPDIIEKNRNRFTYAVSEQDEGVFNAMNKGIGKAKGHYILFLNSGDLLNGANALQDFISHPNFKGDIIYGDYKFEDGDKIYPDTLTPYYFMRTSLPHQSTFFRRSLFESMGLYNEDYKIGADRAFYIKCFMSGEVQFTHINYFLTLFDLSGLSNDPELFQNKKQEDERMFREYFGDRYEEMVALREEEQMRNEARRKSLPGILKRIKRRLSK